MRDRRFIAAHRGGPLDAATHRLLAAWAADEAERVLHYFAAISNDDRPRLAIDAARAWSRSEIAVGAAQRAAVAAHAAARSVTNPSAIAAARAAGHAAATAHMADHCLGAPWYALKAIRASHESPGATIKLADVCDVEHLPAAVRALILSALAGPKFRDK